MKVLVAVDDSQCSQLALASVAARSWPAGTEIMLLSVAEPLAPDYGFFIPEEIVKEQRKTLDQAIEEFNGMLGGETSLIVTAMLAEGYARHRIPEVAREWGAHLIVVGSHGRKGFAHAVMGSVAEAVVHEAPCSVEVVKAQTQKLKSRAAGRLSGTQSTVV
jgi:nucleotide-binding universal stress UspA family protein